MKTIKPKPISVVVDSSASGEALFAINDLNFKSSVSWDWVNYDDRIVDSIDHKIVIGWVRDAKDERVDLDQLKVFGTDIDFTYIKMAFARELVKRNKKIEARRVEELKETYENDIIHAVAIDLSRLLPEGKLKWTSLKNYLAQGCTPSMSLSYAITYTDSIGESHEFSYSIYQKNCGRRSNSYVAYEIWSNHNGTLKGLPRKMSTIATKIKEDISLRKRQIEVVIEQKQNKLDKFTKLNGIFNNNVSKYSSYSSRGGRSYEKYQIIRDHMIEGRTYPHHTGLKFTPNTECDEFTIDSVVGSLTREQFIKILTIVNESKPEYD